MESAFITIHDLTQNALILYRGPYTDDESGEDSSYGTKTKSAYGEWRASGAERLLAARAIKHT